MGRDTVPFPQSYITKKKRQNRYQLYVTFQSDNLLILA